MESIYFRVKKGVKQLNLENKCQNVCSYCTAFPCKKIGKNFRISVQLVEITGRVFPAC